MRRPLRGRRLAMRKSFVVLWLFFLLIFYEGAFSKQAKSKIGDSPAGTSLGEVWINDKLIIKIYSIGNANSHTEADNVAFRLNKAISRNIKPSQVTYYKVKNGYAVTADNEILVVVSKYQAHLHHSTPKDLAVTWASQIKMALKTSNADRINTANRAKFGNTDTINNTNIDDTNETILLAATSHIVLPQGKERLIKMPGASYIHAIKFSDPEVAKVIPEGNTLRIRGERGGWTKVVMEWRNKIRSLTITVKDWAALLPPHIETLVTGWPARGDFVKKAAMETLTNTIFRKPGTKLVINTNGLSFPQFLNAGNAISNYVDIKVTGKDYLPVQGKVQLKVINFFLPKEETAYLLVSNKPEFIRETGIVFSETLLDDKPARFLFHHANALSDEALLLNIKLVNQTDTPSKIHIIEGAGGPHSNEVYTGHVATYQFFAALWRGEGKVINIPPKSQYLLYNKWLSEREVTAGIYQLKVLEGGLPTILVEGRDKARFQVPLTNLSPPGPNEDNSHAKGIFENPKIIIEKEHIIGNKFTFIPIGKKPFLKELFTGEPNYGNYGVTYEIKIKIKNPDEKDRTAKIYFVPTAGIARGIFKLENKLIQTPMLPPYKEFLLGQYGIPSGREQNVVLFTIPQGGSFYPVNVVVQN